MDKCSEWPCCPCENNTTDCMNRATTEAPMTDAIAEREAFEPVISNALHPDTAKLVRRFARALANKLLAAQRKYGYSNNWLRDDWMDECRAELRRHIEKGDPRDVAAYCAFLWHHDASTRAALAGGKFVAHPASEPKALTDEQRIAICAAISISEDIKAERHNGSFLSYESVQALRDLLKT